MTAVLFAALLHASWNAIVKSGTDKFLEWKEKYGGVRYAAAFLVCAGAVSLKVL